jgi:hypothetical protein
MMRGARVALLGVLVAGCPPPWPDSTPQSCEDDSDCEQPEDKRYRTVCAPDDEGDKVCIADFAVVGCGPEVYEGAPWQDLMDPARYAGQCDAAPGTRSCPPPCANGLAENEHGVCDDDDSSTPVAGPIVSGQDVLDQLCRSFFCDDSFVCERGDSVCVPCDEENIFDQSGCHAIYLGDQLSCVYQTQTELDRDCQAPHSAIALVEFGACE